MPAITQAVPEPVNAFPIENTILVKHYFEGDNVFDRLRPYYNDRQYRFEVPVGEFDSLRRFLLNKGYELQIVDELELYYVVIPQYSTHPEGIFKQSVRHEPIEGYHAFLMTDRDAVEAMVARGAERLTEKPLVLQSLTLSDFAVPTA